MTKRTWWYTLVTTLLISGLAACSGGGGGGGGGGGNGIPTATNAAIAPPPTTPVTITTNGGGATSPTNQNIAANSFQSSSGAMSSATTASGLVSAHADTPQAETFGVIVRRHAEKIKDHKSSPTSALQVETQPCSGGGTLTFAFDDASLSSTEVFVNCSEGGTLIHGTVSASNVGVGQNLGPTVGSTYSITVSATFTVDLSITSTAPAASAVTQGSFNFIAGFSGIMEAAGNGGVQPGVPNRVQISMSNANILTSNGTVRELLTNFNFSVDDDDTQGRTTVTGGYTYASTIINGSVTVAVSPPLVFQPQSAPHPSTGTVTITSSASPGRNIVLTVISSPVVGVRVDASDGATTDTVNLTWAQVDAL